MLEPENLTDINNPRVIKHKGRPPKRLMASVEKVLDRRKRVLNDTSNVTEEHASNNNNMEAALTDDIKGRKCGKCRQYGHYAKTCQYNALSVLMMTAA